jgi:hypothetical protein
MKEGAHTEQHSDIMSYYIFHKEGKYEFKNGQRLMLARSIQKYVFISF